MPEYRFAVYLQHPELQSIHPPSETSIAVCNAVAPPKAKPVTDEDESREATTIFDFAELEIAVQGGLYSRKSASGRESYPGGYGGYL
jgi:hypothetical protein